MRRALYEILRVVPFAFGAAVGWLLQQDYGLWGMVWRGLVIAVAGGLAMGLLGIRVKVWAEQ